MKQNLSNLIKNYYNTNESEEAFNKFINYYLININYIVSNYREKEDMKQEAIIKIFELLKDHKLDNLIGKEDYEINAYLKRCIKNKLKDVIKTNYKFFNFEISTDLIELGLLSEDIYFFSKIRFVLEELIEKLTQKQKRVMRMIYLSDLDEGEIADILDVKRQDINSLKNRAKKAIYANLTLNKLGACETPLCEV